MIREAALYLTSPEDARAARTPVSGHPVAFRMLMAAVRAGCRRVWIPAALRQDLEPLIATRPSARAAVAWLDATTPPPSRPLLVLPAAALVPPVALVPLLASSPPAVLPPSQSEGAPVAVLPADRVRVLWPVLASGVGDAVERALKDATATAAVGGWYARVDGPVAAARAEAMVWRSLGSAIDTRLDRTFHRRLSRPLTRLAVACGASPNAVTLASLVVGLVATWCFLVGTFPAALAGLALYAAAVVLDHADGEVARVTLRESAFGSRLDIAVDTTIHVGLMLALGATAERLAGGGAALAGMVAAAGIVGSAAVTQASPALASRGVGTALEALSNRDGFYAMLVMFVAAVAVLPAALPALMILVAVGCHAFWLGRLAYALTRGR